MRFGLRRLARAPLFAAFAIATITIGISITTASYSVVYDFFLRDLGVRDRATLVQITQQAQYFADFSGPEYADVASQVDAFASVCAYTWFQTALTGTTSSEMASAEAVSGNFFQTLGVAAERGRLIQPGDDRPDAPDVMVLADGAWRERFGADSAIVGRRVHAVGRVFEVIGIAPPNFHGVSQLGRFRQSFWIPLAQAPRPGGAARLDLASRDARWLRLIGRLAPGRTMPEARTQLATIAGRLDAIAPLSRTPTTAPDDRWSPGGTNQRRVLAGPALDDSRLWNSGATLAIFVASIPALVLLVACTNLANLVLSRGVSRAHEFTVRRALGASRWRMVREQMADGLVIATVGAICGVLLAELLIRFVDGKIVEVFGAWPQFRFSSRLEPPVLAFAMGATILALVVSSVLPALQLTRPRGNPLAADPTLGGMPRWRGRSNLIALQVAVSVGLFLVTALGVTALRSDVHTTSSTDLHDVAMIDVPLASQQRDAIQGRAILDRVLEEARRSPGVQTVELTTMTLENGIQTKLAEITSSDKSFVPKVNEGERVWVTTVTPGALAMLKEQIRYGRIFDDRDTAGAGEVIIVNAGLAAKLFGRADSVGRQALVRESDVLPRSAPRLMTIAGVTTDKVASDGRTVINRLWMPYAQHFDPNVSLLARGTTDDIAPVLTALRTAVHRVDPDLAITFAGRAEAASQSTPLVALKMFTTAIALLALTALLMAMVGLYGVLSHVVGTRTRELGLRQALGADANRIVWMILKDGFRPVAEGLLIGLAGATVIRFMLQTSFTKAVAAFDPITFALAAGPLLAAAAIACYMPARRAAKVDPNVALRDL